MYVHIGNDEILNREDIIAVFDVNIIKESGQNKKLVEKINERNNPSDQAAIIVFKDGVEKIIFSNIAVSTLKKRLEKGYEFIFSL